MPLETVMDGSKGHQPVYSEIPWKNGGTLIVEKLDLDSARIVRLISTNPLDYLESSIQPGAIIQYKAENQASVN
jgi:hypothetical protein